jgi:transglutaminase-like putative cysteine protease
MLLKIVHETRLEYSEPISETVMEVRVTPRTTPYQTLRGLRIDVGPKANIIEYGDWLGNRVHHFSYLPQHTRVVIAAQSAVECHTPQVSFDVLQSEPIRKEELPLLVRDYLRPSKLTGYDPRLEQLASTLGVTRARSVGEAAALVTKHLIDHIEYKKGVTHSHTKLSDVLTARAGVCQDLTHVALGLLRARGIPARYVSGYLHRPESGEELESHAWCEVYSAERGWVAIDATHRTLAEAGHVSVGVGRDFSDVPPNRGVYRGGGTETISAGVTIEEVKELPEGLLAPRAIHVVGLSGPRPHVEELDYQQQQQQQQQQQMHTHYL